MLRQLGAGGALALAGVLTATQLAGAAFPGANGKIVFSEFDGGDQDVISIAADGSDRVNLTSASAAADVNPSFSADGTEIVFSSDRDGDFDLYVMSADGSGATQRTNDPGVDRQPVFSPDRTKIAFSSDRDGDFDVWTMNADGSGLVNLTDASGAAEGQPSWSPDGSAIAFVRGTAVLRVPSGGGGETVIDDVGPASTLDSVDWSPDGTRVAFGGYQSFPPKIRLKNADGSGTATVYDGEGNGATDPAWSPDGARIAFVQIGMLRVVPSDFSSASTAVTSTAAAAESPTWGSTPASPPPTTTTAPATTTTAAAAAPPPAPEPEPDPVLRLACGSVVSGAVSSSGAHVLVGTLGIGGFVYCVAGASGATEQLSRLTGAVLGSAGGGRLVGSLGQPTARASTNGRTVLSPGFVYAPARTPPGGTP